MCEYREPTNKYSLDYPDGWLPLTQEGSPHVSFASLTTGGYLKVESYEFENPEPEALAPDITLRSLVDCERRCWPKINLPSIQTGHLNGATMAYATFTRPEPGGADSADFGFARAWVLSRGHIQVRCLYRCRNDDNGVDDEELDTMLDSLTIHEIQHLDAGSFTAYYLNLLKRRRPNLVVRPPEGLALTLADGQTVLLDQLYNHYLLEPERMDALIDAHITRLDYCGDDVPDLTNYKAIKKLLFPKVFRTKNHRGLPPHRAAFWPGLSVGAVVQGRVFTYGVNTERLKTWRKDSLNTIMDDLLDNLYSLPPVSPRGRRNDEGVHQAISYVDHPLCASFVLYEDFYDTTAHNLGVTEFLVGLPDSSCVSCFRDDDPRFVVNHTALLRWDYHRSIERLTDAIYLVTGPKPTDVKPYDVLHCCPKKV